MPKNGKATSKSSSHKFHHIVHGQSTSEGSVTSPPRRLHSIFYHRPHLLSQPKSSSALLRWFDSISEQREMPWRKTWIDPHSFTGSEKELQEAQARRGYEVWVSEIMLQQTRVAVVIPYFKSWISKWPTVEYLASATQDEVLAAWKGLGYYSRATRLHEAAQQIVKEMGGAIPSNVEALLKVKGIGPYTAGAGAAIACGRPVPLIDGNVSRVLSRQLALYAGLKDKKIDAILWETAEALVETVTATQSDRDISDVPGRWNQALMELGSTICTPRPKCEECPIQSTCRSFAEGNTLAKNKQGSQLTKSVADMEDVCTLCEILELEDAEATIEDETKVQSKSCKRKRANTNAAIEFRSIATARGGVNNDKKQRGLAESASFQVSARPKGRTDVGSTDFDHSKALLQAKQYCSMFPKSTPKKHVPEEECLVFIIHNSATNQYLIEQRPASGLLASLWQFPSLSFPRGATSTLGSRKLDAGNFLENLMAGMGVVITKVLGERGDLVHVFSHLKLKMYVHCFQIDCELNAAQKLASLNGLKRLWIDTGGVDGATMGTGMSRCWELVRSEFG